MPSSRLAENIPLRYLLCHGLILNINPHLMRLSILVKSLPLGSTYMDRLGQPLDVTDPRLVILGSPGRLLRPPRGMHHPVLVLEQLDHLGKIIPLADPGPPSGTRVRFQNPHLTIQNALRLEIGVDTALRFIFEMSRLRDQILGPHRFFNF